VFCCSGTGSDTYLLPEIFCTHRKRKVTDLRSSVLTQLAKSQSEFYRLVGIASKSLQSNHYIIGSIKNTTTLTTTTTSKDEIRLGSIPHPPPPRSPLLPPPLLHLIINHSLHFHPTLPIRHPRLRHRQPLQPLRRRTNQNPQ